MTLRNPPRVLLIGMMGVGKSTIGQLLSRQLQWPHLDSDAEILRTTGLTVPEIWRAQGEAAFRVEEARVLAEATTSSGPAVISCGGGTVLDAGNRRRIKSGGLVVWLVADPATLAARVGTGTGRPLLDDDPAATLARLAAARTPLYAEVAEMTLETDTEAPAQIVTRIVGRLGELGGLEGLGPGGLETTPRAPRPSGPEP